MFIWVDIDNKSACGFILFRLVFSKLSFNGFIWKHVQVRMQIDYSPLPFISSENAFTIFLFFALFCFALRCTMYKRLPVKSISICIFDFTRIDEKKPECLCCDALQMQHTIWFEQNSALSRYEYDVISSEFIPQVH